MPASHHLQRQAIGDLIAWKKEKLAPHENI
jgi:hypothetical protein